MRWPAWKTPFSPAEKLCAQSLRPHSYRPPRPGRPFSCCSLQRRHADASSSSSTERLPPGWITGAKSTVVRCIRNGLDQPQREEAESILGEFKDHWRELLAGSEGFLAGPVSATFRQHVAWGDMDAMGHVNNVNYLRYAESARIVWFKNFARLDVDNRERWEELWTPRGHGLILKLIRVDYKFPMTFPDAISVFHKLRSAPDESAENFLLDVLIVSEAHKRPAARLAETLLVYDYANGRKAPLPAFMSKQFQETFRQQQEAKEKNCKRARSLLDRVRRLTEHQPPDAA